MTAHRAALVLAVLALAAGIAAWLADADRIAAILWAAAVVPALLLLVVSAGRKLLRGETGVDIIAGLAMAGSLALGQYLAGAVVAAMYLGGTVLEEFAEGRARRELTALLSRAPRTAHRESGDRIEDIPVDAVAFGDRLVVKPGEVLPVDGVVTGEAATLDESALTGEARPVERRPGAPVASGSVNAGGPLRLRATAPAAASTYAGIVRLVEAAQSSRSPFVRMADRYALILLPLALVVAGAGWLLSGDPVRALAVLVVATPCPLILAAPVALVAGMSAAARRGLLFKTGGAFEALARVATVVFDKTGTVTTGIGRLMEIEIPPERGAAMDRDELLRLVASLEQMSHHVVAAAIVAAAQERRLDLAMPQAVTETAGTGVAGTVGGRGVRAGAMFYAFDDTAAPAWASAVARRAERDGASSVFVAIDGVPAGALLLADEIRIEAPRALRSLRGAGISRIVMLTGDRSDIADAVGAALGVDTVLAERTPADKVDAVRAERGDGITAMVGDGINDAPALAAADIGVAMGARGAGAASEAADVVLLVDRLDRLAEGIGIAQRSVRIARQSVVAGMALSGLAMVVAALGWLPPVAGALVQEGIDVAVILNALRALTIGRRARRAGLGAEESRALLADHAALRGVIDRLRRAANLLDGADGTDGGASLVGELREVNRLLAERIVPHEQADEAVLHPQIAPMLGGRDPMAAISRGHREIAHLARRLNRLVRDLPPEGPDAAERSDIRRVLHALEAILRLHFAQEDEIYDSLAEA